MSGNDLYPLTEEQRAALIRHGYNPALPPRGVTGPPDEVVPADHLPGIPGLRNHVCYLDGIEIDGHEASDLDPTGACIHCGEDLNE